jgi:hypothetical protein
MGPTVQHTNLKVHNYDSLCVALCAAQALCSMIISLILHGNAAVLDFDSQLEVLRGTLCLHERPPQPASTVAVPAGGAIPTPTYKCKHCRKERTLCASLAKLQSTTGSDFHFPNFCFDCSRMIPAGAKKLPVAGKLASLAVLSPRSGGMAAARAPAEPSSTGKAPPDTNAATDPGEGRVAPIAPAKTACHEMGTARVAQSPPERSVPLRGTESLAKKASPPPRGRKTTLPAAPPAAADTAV